MGRPKMQPGTYGTPNSYPLKDGRRIDSARGADAYRARVYYVGHDGIRHEKMATAPKRALAESRVVEAVKRELRGAGDSRWTSGTLLIDACSGWLDALDTRSDRSARTKAEYRAAFTRHIDCDGSAVRGLTLAQANDVWTLQRFLQGIADKHGVSSTRHVKAVLSGTFGDALRYRVIDHRALSDVGRIRDGRPAGESSRDTSRAFTPEERRQVVEFADAHAAVDGLHTGTRRKRKAVADLMAFLSGTGARIGEAVGVEWSDVDLDAARVHIRGTKSRASDRHLSMPSWLVDRLRELPHADQGYVFHSPRLLDPLARWDTTNAGKAVSDTLALAGCPWARSHTFRKSVATTLAAGGVPINAVADQLGHSDPSMTMRVYLGRDADGDKSGLAALL